MANYATLKAAINAVIKANGNKEITGTVLNETLTAMVNILGANYQFAGVATPSTNPGTPDQNVFYIAGQAGTYTNFNGIVLPDGVSVLMWNGSWSSQTVLIGDGGVFDLSAYNAVGGVLATYADLSAALTALNALPAAYKRGGMSFKFVQRSDNKYVQYRLMSTTWSTTVSDWQGVDDIPTAGSENLIKSGAVYKSNISAVGFNFQDSKTEESSSGGFNWDIEQVLCKGVKYYVLATGLDNIVASGAVNFYGDDADDFSTPIFQETLYNNTLLEVTPNADVHHIKLQRGSKIGTGTVNLHIYAKSELDKRTVQEIGNSETNIMSQKAVTDTIFGKKTIDTFTATAGVNLGYYVKGDIASFAGKAVDITITENFTNNHALTIIAQNSSIVNLESHIVYAGEKMRFNLPSNTAYIVVQRSGSGIVSSGTGTITIQEIGDVELRSSKRKTIYVSTSGDDANEGTTSYPLATINAALERGADTIIMKSGIYNQRIDLTKATSNKVKLTTDIESSRVIIKPAKENYVLIEDGSETLETGTTKVYKKVLSAGLISDKLKWLWQENVADESTLINDAERHPLQRGEIYRLENTRIKKIDASNVSEAISAIEASNDYLWYFDNSTNTLYFSRPQTSSVSRAICRGKNLANLFSGTDRGIQLTMAGIDVWYQLINITHMATPHLYNCSAKYVCSTGGVNWSGSIGVVIEKCEAAGVQYGTNGDGFNASNAYLATDPFAYHTSAKLVDCWSHDNADDGYSSHERCESVIQGGLFEYNTKGGITPAYGEHCQCYNVISRKNINGFYYTGEVPEEEGGKYGQAICFGCVSKNNSQVGFRCDGTGNKLIAIGCKSINDVTSYKTTDSNSSIELTDCSSSGATTIKSGNIVVTNTTLVD